MWLQARNLESQKSMPQDAPRVAVVGATGCGKTTFARHLACRLDVPYVELDALHWDPNWAEAPQNVFRERVEQALGGEAWVADGDHGQIAFARATSVVWLDYPLAFVFLRLLMRTSRRAITREELWSGNREPLLRSFTRDSLFLWLFSTYGRRRRVYEACMRDPRYPHLNFVRLRTPRQAESWLAAIDGPTPFDVRTDASRRAGSCTLPAQGTGT
jgi:adenylate kinase family enzyme